MHKNPHTPNGRTSDDRHQEANSGSSAFEKKSLSSSSSPSVQSSFSPQRPKKSYSPRSKHKAPRQNWFASGQIRKTLVYMGIGVLLLYVLWVYFAVATQLPRITNDSLEQGNFAQTSVMTDREDKTLYKFYEENRKFVAFEDIAPQTINAFVAIEDKTFWKNGGVDYSGILRNIYNSFKRLLGVKVRVGGASTITQQLLKNILVLDANEENFYDTIVRKHKERLLVGKLADVIKSDIRKKNPGSSANDIDIRMKERVIELYINFIYLGHQAYGVQAASQAYFGKDAKDLSIVEGAILASLPQSPSYYDPYINPHRVIGGLVVTSSDGEEVGSGAIYTYVVNHIAGLIQGSSSTLSSSNTTQKFAQAHVPENITIDGSIYSVQYVSGRKDAVLNRMYDDGYISAEELKEAFLEGLAIHLSGGKTSIEAPHFVFWVRDLLLHDERFKNLAISEDMLYQGGYHIKTSLDLDIQHQAESDTRNAMSILHDYGGNNRAMIHIDSSSGDVLAYVGSANYNDESIDGQVDMIRAKRQPGSSIKPLIYGYYLQQVPSTIDTPVYDIPFEIDGRKPNNSDGGFDGLMSLREALGASRNIPAIKVYLGAGAERNIKPFLQNIGMKSLDLQHDYGYSLMLGAGETSILEMAQSYSAYSQLGDGVTINPILEIRDKHGNILYEKQVKKEQTELSSGAAWLIWDILSNDTNAPAGWRGRYAVPGLTYAKKTGTTNKIVQENGQNRTLPADGWIAAYTPKTVTMYRAGNTKNKAMKPNAFGINLSATLNQSFLGTLVREGKLENTPMHKPSDVQELVISKLTGKRATDATPEELKVTTYGVNTNLGEDGEYASVSIDTSCYGKVSPLTPPQQRSTGIVFEPNSITAYDTKDILERYQEQHANAGPYAKYFAQDPEEYCEGRAIQQSDTIQLSLSLKNGDSVATSFPLEFTARSSSHPITNIMVIANGSVIRNFSYASTSIQDTRDVNLITLGDISALELQVVALDSEGRANSVNLSLKVLGEDTDNPVLDTQALRVDPRSEGGYDIQLRFSDPSSSVKDIDVRYPDNTLHHFEGALAQFSLGELGTISYTARDVFGNALNGSLNLADHL